MSPYAWAVLAHILVGLGIVAGATVLAWHGVINGEAATAIYVTATTFVGASGIQTVSKGNSG